MEAPGTRRAMYMPGRSRTGSRPSRNGDVFCCIGRSNSYHLHNALPNTAFAGCRQSCIKNERSARAAALAAGSREGALHRALGRTSSRV